MRDLFRPVSPPADEDATSRRRVAWFALIAVVSALVVAALAYALRFLLR